MDLNKPKKSLAAYLTEKVGIALWMIIFTAAVLVAIVVVLVGCARSGISPQPTSTMPTSNDQGTGVQMTPEPRDTPGVIEPLTQPETEKETPKIESSAEDQAGQKVGPGVVDTLQANGEVNVIIMLAEPPSMKAPQIDLSTVKREIAGLQGDVLSELDNSDFRVKNKYQTVPALAGTVSSKAGLAKLVANPNVIRIDLDIGGTGSQ